MTPRDLLAVLDGYARHKRVMEAIANEPDRPRSDGFAPVAAEVARSWHRRLLESINAQDDRDVLLQLLSTIRETGRYYSEADLSWSKLWATYEPEHEHWLNAIKKLAMKASETDVSREEFRVILSRVAVSTLLIKAD